MIFLFEHWFCRGVQAAIAQYAGCVPCRSYVEEHRRRKEGARVRKERKKQLEEIVTSQPQKVRHMQPAPFETNEGWAHELVAGPGPPKGWKRDKLTEKLKQKYQTLNPTSQGSELVMTGIRQGPRIVSFAQSSSTSANAKITANDLAQTDGPGDLQLIESSNAETLAQTSTSLDSSEPSEERDRNRSSESFEAGPEVGTSRPSMERRLSSAVDNIKETLRTTLHPEKWNWIRYDREDEVLTELNTRMSRMWDKMTGKEMTTKDESEGRKWYGRKRADTTDSDQVHEWSRGKHPALNDLHPAVVSQLPATPEQAHWMLLPPPSADVMAGRLRPGADAAMRWPLAICGKAIVREPEHSNWDESRRPSSNRMDNAGYFDSDGTRTPELSTSSEDTESEEHSHRRVNLDGNGEIRSQSLPLPGWSPVPVPRKQPLSIGHSLGEQPMPPA